MRSALVLLILAAAACGTTAPNTTSFRFESSESAAPAGFVPMFTAQGGPEILVVTGSAHGSLCDSRLQPSTARNGSHFVLQIVRAFVPSSGNCQTDRKIDFVATFELVQPGVYTVDVMLDDQVLDQQESAALGPVTVAPCDLTCS